jgi:5-methylcytosine-specific restriction endonuclease McrA
VAVRSVFVVDGKKRCSRCKEWLAVEEHFNRDPRMLSGWRGQCRACHKLTVIERRPPEYFAAWHEQKRADPKYRAVLIQRQRVNSQTPAARASRRRRENEYFRLRPAKRAEKNKKAYALRRGAPTATLTAAQWRGVQAVFGGLCAYCQQKPGDTMDHFVPVASGGKHDVSNVVPACRACNSSKRHRDPFEWMEEKGHDGDLVVALICETRRCA